MSSIYHINKGISKTIEFKGLKAQYIWYFAIGVLVLMVFFSILYIIGLNTFLSLGIILGLGAIMITKLYAWSSKYGEHGMMKALAAKKTPKLIVSRSRRIFQNLNLLKP